MPDMPQFSEEQLAAMKMTAALDEQNDVMERAWAIYHERYRTYGDAWAEHPLEDTLMHITSKMARLRVSAEAGNFEVAVDNALDLINYACFLVRRLEWTT